MTLQSSGTTRRVVFRRQDPAGYVGRVETTRAEARTIDLAYQGGAPVPELLVADAEGEAFGAPTLVMTFEGHADVSPRDEGPWLAQLAAALARIHQTAQARHDLAYLPVLTVESEAAAAEATLAKGLPDHVLAKRIRRTLRSTASEVMPLPPSLLHGDFHPGNIVWRRGRLGAVVDWSKAAFGDPRIDMAQCRSELAVIRGLAASEAFLAFYEAENAMRTPDIWFFDLIQGARALVYHERWLSAYREQGLVLTTAEAHTRVVAYLKAALRVAEA